MLEWLPFLIKTGKEMTQYSKEICKQARHNTAHFRYTREPMGTYRDDLPARLIGLSIVLDRHS